MNKSLQKRPFIISDNGYTKLERLPLSRNEFQESWMQQLLQRFPQLLPVAGIDTIYAPLVCIGREVATQAGYIDNLYISPKGYITIVETKLWRNPEARREVVGQIIDYAKELQSFSYERLDKIVKAYNKNNFGIESGLFQTMVEHQLLEAQDETLFVDIVENNLSNARFLLLIVGDGIRDGVWRMAEFLNSTPNLFYRIALVELEVYQLPNQERLVVPNLLMETKTIERGVFRFENGAILPSPNESTDENENGKNKPLYTQEDFIKSLIRVNPTISEASINRFIDDLNDLGFEVSPYGKNDLRIKYPLPGGKKYLNTIYLSADYNSRAYKNLNTLEKDLIKYGYSGEIAKTFYKELQPYQNDKLGGKGTINHDLPKMLQDEEFVITVFERLISHF